MNDDNVFSCYLYICIETTHDDNLFIRIISLLDLHITSSYTLLLVLLLTSVLI